ncbi:type II toxin-antitoxin system VapC family toxin [Nocardioides sp.]|uniref:type II toxin-antitoxin system VapC family toxin n=1 Tax=Nocardioides sp. TaxID=35761 RepID=UPI002ED84525
MTAAGLLDTSVFIASESGRELAVDRLPDESLVCVVTLAELEAGVLAAPTTEIRAKRLRTAQRAASIVPLPIDAPAAATWARLRVVLHEAGRRIGLNDLWIASVAVSRDLPVVTQDDDFDVLAELGLLQVVRV